MFHDNNIFDLDWYGFFVQKYINLYGLFNAKVILVEGKL